MRVGSQLIAHKIPTAIASDAVLGAELCNGTEGIGTKDRRDFLITNCAGGGLRGLSVLQTQL